MKPVVSIDVRRIHRAFTLMELLVVLVIVSILISILIAAIPMVMGQAKILTTQQRMQQVKTQLGLRARETNHATFYLQRGVAGFGGTLAFERKADDDYMIPADGDTWHRVYPDPQGLAPLVLAYPWGQRRAYHIREAWYANAFDPPLAVDNPNAWSDEERAAWAEPEAHDLTELYPRLSGEILVQLELAESLSGYRDDRDPSRAWNDAWGNPLVVAYAIFQPPRYEPPDIDDWATGQFYSAGEWVRDGGKRYICILTHINPTDPSDSGNRPGSSGGAGYWVEALYDDDYYLQEAYEHYSYTRSVYIAVGAAGDILDPSTFPRGVISPGDDASTWEGHLDALWEQICAVCMDGPTVTWNEDSFDDPPWEGTRIGQATYHGAACRCLLTTPGEFK